MKKYLLLISIMLSGVCYSQNFNKVNISILLHWNNTEWVEVVRKYPEDMYIILNDKDIVINNANESHYKIISSSPEKKTYSTHTCYTWACIDKKGISCKFIMKIFNDGTWIFCFLYDSYNQMYEYIIEKDGDK